MNWKRIIFFSWFFSWVLIYAPELNRDSLGGQKLSIPVGTTVFGPFSINGKTSKYTETTIDRTLWTDPASFLNATVDGSNDNGTTWYFLCGFGSRGGVAVSPKTIVSCPMPPELTTVRVTAVVTGGEVLLSAVPTVVGKGNR